MGFYTVNLNFDSCGRLDVYVPSRKRFQEDERIFDLGVLYKLPTLNEEFYRVVTFLQLCVTSFRLISSVVWSLGLLEPGSYVTDKKTE